MCVQRVWQEVWKRDIRCVAEERGEGRGWRVCLGGAILKSSFGSPCWKGFFLLGEWR